MRKNYLLTFLIVFGLLSCNYSLWGQLSIGAANTDVTITFDSTVSGVNSGVFAGSGFAPSPSAGQLDSNAWIITGMADGDTTFGGTFTSGDHARGSDVGGGVTTGGTYAFDVGSSDFALGVQPIGSDFTPGTIVLRIINNTGITVNSVSVSYEAWVNNDQARANSFNFSYSTDNSSYTDVGALDITSTAAADASGFVQNDRSTTISVTLTDGEDLYIRWSGDDVSGSGSRDEFAIDDITVNMQFTTTWDGDTSTHWETSGNWSDGVPTSTANAIIPSGTPSSPEIHDETAGEVTNLEIADGATLTINGNNSIVVSGDLTILGSGKMLIKSNATTNGSLILGGAFTGPGTVDYEREYEDDEWHLTSAPVAGQSISTFSADLLTSGSDNKSIAIYDNSKTSDPHWTYYTVSNIGSAGDFLDAKGYSIQKATAGTLTFSGTPAVSDIPFSITDHSGASGNKWNLVGNPFPAFVALNDDADPTDNFLTVNSADLDPARVAVYMWNPSTDSYDIFNHATGTAKYAAPGQAFFIESVDGGATIDFTKAMQSHQTGDLFLRNSTSTPEVKLFLSDGSSSVSTEIKYRENQTTGLDLGWDAGVFSGDGSSFKIYTHLVSGSQGENFALQVLPDSNYENMIIPIGVNATSGTEITISADAVNLPSGINVYLEDKENNSFTLLESGSDFTTTLTNDLNGIGRFYMHTSSQALSTDEINLNNISMYTSSENNLRIVGVQNGDADVKIYNILGKLVVRSSFQGNGVNDITLPNLRTGVYIIQLETSVGKLNKKVIIE